MLKIILVLLFAHYYADFILQPTDWGVKKWNNLWVLSKHILTYALSFFLVTWLFLIPDNWNIWLMFLIAAGVNGFIHFWIDYITSKVNHYLWSANQNMFWKVIGLDQLLHYITIALIYTQLYQLINSLFIPIWQI